MKIDVDATSATVTLNVSGTFDAQALRDLIQSLCNAREQIADDPADPRGLTLDLTGNTGWHTEPLAIDRTISVLLVRLRGLGWHGITLDSESRNALIQLLITQSSFAIDGPGETAGSA